MLFFESLHASHSPVSLVLSEVKTVPPIFTPENTGSKKHKVFNLIIFRGKVCGDFFFFFFKIQNVVLDFE